jgi:Fic family protein
LPEFCSQLTEQIENLRKQLNYATSDNLNRWTGFLARMSYARAIHGSNAMEGINATLEDAVNAIDGEPPPNPKDENWLALTGHRDAMDYVIQLSKEPNYSHNEGTLLGLHFMMMKYDLSKYPGRYRPGPIHVTHMPSGRTVYEGPDFELVPGLMDELIDSLNAKNNCSVIIRAAMAHLNLAMIHPFKDGNGRMSRALQTFVLAREGILDPRFSSIEEYVGSNTLEYYDVLSKVGRGQWNPQHDALPWVKFCLKAHYYQAQTLLKRVQQTDALWEKLEKEVERRRLPVRTMFALMNAAVGMRVRNPVYRTETDVSHQVAKLDLKRLIAEGLLVAKGEKRGRVYLASDYLTELRNQSKITREIVDPFGEETPPPKAKKPYLSLPTAAADAESAS